MPEMQELPAEQFRVVLLNSKNAVLDYLIIGRERFVSLNERGLGF